MTSVDPPSLFGGSCVDVDEAVEKIIQCRIRIPAYFIFENILKRFRCLHACTQHVAIGCSLDASENSDMTCDYILIRR
jgi:hypothetical protein